LLSSHPPDWRAGAEPKRLALLLHAGQGAALVAVHQRVAGDVGRDDCCQPALLPRRQCSSRRELVLMVAPQAIPFGARRAHNGIATASTYLVQNFSANAKV